MRSAATEAMFEAARVGPGCRILDIAAGAGEQSLAAARRVGAGGHVLATDIAPLASPKIWRHVPRWLADPTGPLSIRPAYALQALPWMLRFSRASSCCGRAFAATTASSRPGQ